MVMVVTMNHKGKGILLVQSTYDHNENHYDIPRAEAHVVQ